MLGKDAKVRYRGGPISGARKWSEQFKVHRVSEQERGLGSEREGGLQLASIQTRLGR